MTRISRFLVLLSGLTCLSMAGEPFTFRDDFTSSGAAPTWSTTSIIWEARDGAYRAASIGRGFAHPAKAPHAKRIVIETTVTPRKADGSEWKIAGLAVRRDERNFWHFAFVEG
ncbi:hypothetical protein HQ560_12070, partial [bacterium]|nr:hypothetical protein [bacterium]